MSARTNAIAIAAITAAMLGGCVVVTDFGSFSGQGRRDGGDDPRLDGSIDVADGGDAGTRADGDVDDPECDPACGDGEQCVDGACRCGDGDACGEGLACCNGECIDTESELAHCGACDATCESAPNATRACTSGSCEQTCEEGFLDCSGAPGCESSVSSITSCGACGNACAGGQRCAQIGGAWQCASACPAGTVNCGGSCVDPMRDVSHCGGCDMVCPALGNATRGCSAGACGYACEGSYADCDGDLGTSGSNGCERVPPLYFTDADGDGVGTGSGARHCPGAAPSGWVAGQGDCDDTDAARFPGQIEACNGRDDDCDPTSDEGYAWMGSPLGASCSCESGARTGVVSCATATMASCAFPAEACNGRDDDCDGTDDDGYECVAGSTGSCAVTNGACTATGTRRCDAVTCGWESCELPPETCDAVDSDCDGFVDDGALAPGPSQPVVSATTISEIAWHPTAGQGGAILYFVDGSPRRLYFQRIDSSAVPVGDPVRIAEGSISFRMGIGWDGEQWAVFYPIDVGINDWQLHVVRVTSAGVAGSAVSLGQRCETVRAHSNGTSLGVVWIAGGNLMRGAIYARGAWTRAPFDLMSTAGSVRFTNDYDVVPAGGDDHVMVTTVNDGSVRFRVFDPTALQTERSILTDADLEYPLRAAVIGNRLGLGWREGGNVGAAGVFDLATGAVVRTNALDLLSNDVHIVAVGSAFLIGSTIGAQRMRTDGMLFPERVAAFPIVNAGDLVASPGGRWAALRVVVPSAGETIVQGLGCP